MSSYSPVIYQNINVTNYIEYDQSLSVLQNTEV